MNENEIIKKLTEKGGKLWEKNGMRRIYFDASAWGLETNRYKTGNISSAALRNERISNSEAYRCEAVKVWYDLVDGQFHTKNDDQIQTNSRSALQDFIANAL